MAEYHKKYIIAHIFSNYRITFSDIRADSAKICRCKISKDGFIRSCIVHSYMYKTKYNDDYRFMYKYDHTYKHAWMLLAHWNNWKLILSNGNPQIMNFSYKLPSIIKKMSFEWPFSAGRKNHGKKD